MNTITTIEIKAYSISELARMYGISNKSMNRWLKPHAGLICKREGRYYTALQVRIIFNKLGLPGKIYEAPTKRNGWQFVFSYIYLLKIPFWGESENWQL